MSNQPNVGVVVGAAYDLERCSEILALPTAGIVGPAMFVVVVIA